VWALQTPVIREEHFWNLLAHRMSLSLSCRPRNNVQHFSTNKRNATRRHDDLQQQQLVL
jgi:hypothetical protein